MTSGLTSRATALAPPALDAADATLTNPQSAPSAKKLADTEDDTLCQDSDLNDVDLSDLEEQQASTSQMSSYRNNASGAGAGVEGVKLGAVANAIASCSALSFFSISMILANKALAYNFEAHLNLLPMAFQCFVAVILVETSRRMGWVQYESFNLTTALRWFPIAVFFCAMLVSSFLSYRYMNVPMVTVFKSLTNLVIVTGDYFWHNQSASSIVLLSLGVMTGGAILASWSDIEFKAWGYFWMTANCFATASYVLTMKFATRTMKLPKFGMVFYNNLLGFIIMLPVAMFFGELFTFREGVTGFLDREDLHSFKYLSINLFAGAAGFFLNFAALWCVSATSATTYAVVNTVNNFPVSIIGYFLFNSKVSGTQAEFILVNIIGGFIYSGGKIKEQEDKKREEMERLGQESGDVEAVPLVSGTQDDFKRSPNRRP